MNLPHRKKLQIDGFDYWTEALYFITANVKDNLHLFGKVKDKKMILNRFGESV